MLAEMKAVQAVDTDKSCSYAMMRVLGTEQPGVASAPTARLAEYCTGVSPGRFASVNCAEYPSGLASQVRMTIPNRTGELAQRLRQRT